MAKYTTAPASAAEWSGSGYPGDTGNPSLTHVYRDGKWFAAADAEDAEYIRQCVEWVEKAHAYKMRVAQSDRDIAELFNEVGL